MVQLLDKVDWNIERAPPNQVRFREGLDKDGNKLQDVDGVIGSGTIAGGDTMAEHMPGERHNLTTMAKWVVEQYHRVVANWSWTQNTATPKAYLVL